MRRQTAPIKTSLVLAVAVLASACADKSNDDRAPVEYRPPVRLYGKWVRVQPNDGDTLVIDSGGKASGPAVASNVLRTTRWIIDREVAPGMFCMGDKVQLHCLPVRQFGDTLAFLDQHRSIYLRARPTKS